MIISHFMFGFITSYLGFTPPSMLNLTVGKICLEKDKKSAYQFTLGASVVVVLQFILSFLIVRYVYRLPNIFFWIKNVGIFVFVAVSLYFFNKGFFNKAKKKEKEYKNNFMHGLFLSLLNMFAIPFFAVVYSLLIKEGFINLASINIITFAFGIFFGAIAILVSYVFLINKIKRNILFLTKFINPVIGTITGCFAIYSAVKLYL